MAPKKYTPERLNEIAIDSAKTFKGLLQSGDLTCEYIFDGEDETIKGSEQIKFRWYIESFGYNDTCEMFVRCNSVTERGVPFPDRWKQL